MHCPRCGQQQISEEIKYCSRCGFSLGLVMELIANGGFLPQLSSETKKGILPTRKTGVKIGVVWFLVITFLLTPLFAIINADELAGMLAVLGFMGGILIIAISWMFLEKENSMILRRSLVPMENNAAQLYGNPAAQTALPPQTSRPVESYAPPVESWKAPNTGELAKPGSVTEGTTKLLNKNE